MKPLLKKLLIPALLLAALPAVAAGTPSTAVRLDGESFQIIARNSIFDPRRGPTPPPPHVEPLPEHIVLAGTMSYANQSFAFFDGTNPQWRRVVRPADTIAGLKVLEISGHSVRLTGPGTPTVKLDMQAQMSKPPGGMWSVTDSANSKKQ